MINHHPSDETLLRQASGTLEAGPRIVVAVHIGGCRACAERIAQFEAAGGLFLDNRLQRSWRDVNAVAKHISVNWDAVGSMYGQHAFGLEPRGQY